MRERSETVALMQQLTLWLCLWTPYIAAHARRTAMHTDISTLQPGVRTTVANSLWGNDAFPGTPPVPAGGSLTIGYFNTTGGGVVTEIHLVLEGSLSVIQRHMALSITYDGLPHPSVFVPVGDFFGDQENGQSSHFENAYFARRPRNSWFCYIPMPYKTSIKIELVNNGTESVQGYNYVYHDSKPWVLGTGYFHAHYESNELRHFPWDAAPILPQQGFVGPGHLLGTQLLFVANDSAPFQGNFDHVCEGNYEIFFDNATLAYGNDSSVDWIAAGYQTSEHVIAILGSEDWYGYSFGWSGDEADLGVNKSLWGTTWTGTTWWDKPIHQGGPRSRRTLATYQFFPSPLRFTTAAWGQVNWHYDTGHNVPENLCPPGEGCAVAYQIISYWYLAEPRDASAEIAKLPWPYPLHPSD